MLKKCKYIPVLETQIQSRSVPVFSIHNFSTLTIPQKYVILKL